MTLTYPIEPFPIEPFPIELFPMDCDSRCAPAGASRAASEAVSFAEAAALWLGKMLACQEPGRTGDHAVFVAMLAQALAGLPNRCNDPGEAGGMSIDRHHVEASTAAMTRLGLHERATRLWTAAVARDDDTVEVVGEVVRRGSVWELRVGEQSIALADTVGVQRLLHLLQRPFVDIRATDLVGGVEPASRHAVADTRALRAYHDRIRDLRHDIDQADADNDIAKASQLRDELDTLLTHLRSSEALAGRSRAFADGHERARIAVRKSLSRVFDEVSLQAPEFAEELAASIRTGSTCRFHPRNRFPTIWRHTTRDPQHDH